SFSEQFYRDLMLPGRGDKNDTCTRMSALERRAPREKAPGCRVDRALLNWRETETEGRIRTAYLRQSEAALPPQWRVSRKQGLPGRYSLRRFSFSRFVRRLSRRSKTLADNNVCLSSLLANAVLLRSSVRSEAANSLR